MRINKYNIPILNDNDVFNLLYQGDTSIIKHITVDNSVEIEKLEEITEFSLCREDLSLTIQEFDISMQKQWFMPPEYYSFDIFEYCISKCSTPQEIERVKEELDAFNHRNLNYLLQWLKFFVDTCTKNNIFWGVGRGSSVSSYVLYLIGIHKINSIKYNLDWREFLR